MEKRRKWRVGVHERRKRDIVDLSEVGKNKMSVIIKEEIPE